MRRLLLLPALLLLLLAAAACTSSTSPGWTYAAPTEAPSATPAPSGGASGAPASEAPSSGSGGTVLQLSALNVQFDQTELSAPADTAFTIHFNNKDTATPHDVVIKDANGAEKFKGTRTDGPQEIDYQVPALPAGTYTFVCSFHPNMTGTLTVGG
jgi:plastocyanin